MFVSCSSNSRKEKKRNRRNRAPFFIRLFASDISAGVLAIYSPPPIASHAMPLARPPVGYRKGNALRWRSVALDCALLEGSASPRIGNWVPAQTGTPLMARGLVGSESQHLFNSIQFPQIQLQSHSCNWDPIPQFQFRIGTQSAISMPIGGPKFQ